ncbi:DNA-directed RNA polymerase subunit omega [Clostridium acetireducens DSM 10703]|jgi:DNA-directed RNA polymerase subunit omega|uniref:DNA-directed RNA polymerase subunit omega n=1 Tax=Clostridium acetireducens DSM 10703 TaxID=1121290 RepID=A0A1E8F1Z4_9CLOT|nr:DNA-directed RNA polymerase subunit omega [Clostridium acetireducens]OFI07665.1 DNA-directed RNA polymerase subunit omega [Clostridium acetireducens DSM 10703]
MNNSMINPSIVDLMKKINNRYILITMTAKRARQLIRGEEALIDIDSTKPVTVSINEINQEKISYETVKEGIK